MTLITKGEVSVRINVKFLMLTRNKNKSVKYFLGTIVYVIILCLLSLMGAALPVKYFNGPY